MSDRRDDEFEDETWAPPPDEGVRVVGDQGRGEPPAGPAERQVPPVSRFPLPGGEGPSWSAASDAPPRRGGQGGQPGGRGFEDETGPDGAWDQGGADQGARMPHWTEPATGEVPRVLGGDRSDSDFDAWNQPAAAGPRFRTGDSDWAEGDWGEGELSKDETMGVAEQADHDEIWEPPRRRGRRGRGRDRDREPEHEEAPIDHGPGGLEGPAQAPQQFDDYGYADEHDAPAAPADLTPRLITAGIVAAVAIIAFAAGRGPAMVLVTAIVGLSAFELYAAFQRAGYHPATAIGLLGCVAIVPIAYNQGERAYPLVMFLVVVFTFLWYLVEVVRARPTVNIGLTLLPFAWIGMMGGFAGMLLAPDPGGTGLLLGVVICAVGSDVVGYFVGRSMGRTPLLPRVSPNKTMEGFIAGAIAAIVLGGIVGAVVGPWKDFGIGAGLMLGILVAVTAPIGDLVESMIKRDLGLKDLGTFLPGHGGFLDRFDAILFTLPVAFYWAYHLFTT